MSAPYQITPEEMIHAMHIVEHPDVNQRCTTKAIIINHVTNLLRKKPLSEASDFLVKYEALNNRMKTLPRWRFIYDFYIATQYLCDRRDGISNYGWLTKEEHVAVREILATEPLLPFQEIAFMANTAEDASMFDVDLNIVKAQTLIDQFTDLIYGKGEARAAFEAAFGKIVTNQEEKMKTPTGIIPDGYVSEHPIKTAIVVTKEEFVAAMSNVTVPKQGYLMRLQHMVSEMLENGQASDAAHLLNGFNMFDSELRTLPNWSWIYRFKAAANTYRPSDSAIEETAYMRFEWLTEEQQKQLHAMVSKMDNLPYQEMALDSLTNDTWECHDTAISVARITNQIIWIMAKSGIADGEV